MTVDEALVRRVAELAALELDDDEVARFAPQLASILAHAEELAEVPDADQDPDLDPDQDPDADQDPDPDPDQDPDADQDPDPDPDAARLRAAAPQLADDHFVFPRAVRGAE